MRTLSIVVPKRLTSFTAMLPLASRRRCRCVREMSSGPCTVTSTWAPRPPRPMRISSPTSGALCSWPVLSR